MTDEDAYESDKSGKKVEKIKIAILGKALVGKSALTYRFISDKFLTDHDTTVEDQYNTRVTVNDIECDLEILDTAGQDDYQCMMDAWIEFGNCYLLVYAIDDLESFKLIKHKYDRICQVKNNENISVVIVGNKRDLPDSQRKVNRVDAEYFAKNIDVPSIEVSALTKYNVREAFLLVVNDYLKKNKTKKTKLGISCPCF